MKRVLSPLLGLLLAVWAGSAFGAIIHVPGDYATIYAAVQAAAAGDIVEVAAGTYQDCTHESEGPGSTLTCVIMKSGVTLRGAGPLATIIDAQSLGRGIYVADVTSCTIENLQVTGAFAEVYGAGILCKRIGDVVTLTDIRITGNTDGGIIAISHANLILTRVNMVANVAKQGGGIAVEDTSVVTMSDCLVDGNTAPSGAGVFVRSSQTTIDACVVSNNAITADYGNGGGIAVQDGNLTLTHSEIRGNTTLGYGGGLVFTNNATGLIYDCLVIDNAAAGPYNEGAGVYASQSPVHFLNTVIAANQASGPFAEGGGVAVSFDPSPVFEHCTLVGNSGSNAAAGGGVFVSFYATPHFDNCLIVNSSQGKGVSCGIEGLEGAPVFTGCDIWGNAGGNDLCGTDNGCNFAANPLFCTEPGVPYRIQPSSPAAAGHHPQGSCGATYCGAYPAGCEDVAVEDLPDGRQLTLGNTPNPFNPLTTIHFLLDVPGDAMIRIFDLRGHAVRSFRFQNLLADHRYEVTWNGTDDAGLAMPSGVYPYQLDAGGATTSKRMSLIR